MHIVKGLCLLLFQLMIGVVWANPGDERPKLTFSVGGEAILQEISRRVLKEAYNEINYDIVVLSFPNGRALIEANSGSVDGEISRIANIELKYINLVQVPIPINKVEAQLFTIINNKLEIDPSNLIQYEPLCIRGVLVIEKYAKEKVLRCQFVTQFSQALQMMAMKRNQLAIIPKVSGIYHIHRLDLTSQVVPIGETLSDMPLYHYLHHSHAHLIEDLTKVLQDMEQTGRIADIRQQFLNQLYR